LHHFPDVPEVVKRLSSFINPNGSFISLHEPTLSALGWESHDLLTAMEIFLSGEHSAEKMRTNALKPLQTTDIWVFTPDDLRTIFKNAGFSEIHTLPRGAMHNWSAGLAENGQLKPQERAIQIKRAADLDFALAEVLPDSFFGSLAIHGIIAGSRST
jgi:hypothetical protein